ncbi:MAG: hypothetical protein ACREBR_04570 [bacterium]
MMNGTSVASAPTLPPQMMPGNARLKLPEEDCKLEPERCRNESFSKSILLEKLVQYYAGKYTRKYIDTYIEFCHLGGYLTNLDYLDIKEKMSKE